LNEAELKLLDRHLKRVRFYVKTGTEQIRVILHAKRLGLRRKAFGALQKTANPSIVGGV
jgi:hypothetical protein